MCNTLSPARWQLLGLEDASASMAAVGRILTNRAGRARQEGAGAQQPLPLGQAARAGEAGPVTDGGLAGRQEPALAGAVKVQAQGGCRVIRTGVHHCLFSRANITKQH